MSCPGKLNSATLFRKLYFLQYKRQPLLYKIKKTAFNIRSMFSQ